MLASFKTALILATQDRDVFKLLLPIDKLTVSTESIRPVVKRRADLDPSLNLICSVSSAEGMVYVERSRHSSHPCSKRILACLHK